MIGTDMFAVGALWLWLRAIEGNTKLNWVMPSKRRAVNPGMLYPNELAVKHSLHPPAGELLHLGSYDLGVQDRNTQSQSILVDELAGEFKQYTYHVVSLQNCDREFMMSLGAELKKRGLNYLPLHCFDFERRDVRNPGLVIFFDASRVSLIDAKKSFMADCPYFKALQAQYAKLHVSERFFNFEGTKVPEQRNKDLPDELMLLAYFALKGSQLRFKVANLHRSVLSEDDMYLNRTPAPPGLAVDPAEGVVFMMHPINRYMHLSVRHALVEMQHFLGQSSCFDDHKFIMGNLGVLRKRFGDGPLASALLYGRVPFLQYAQAFGFDSPPGAGMTSIYTGLYDSVFFWDRRRTSVLPGFDLLDPLGHCNLILNSSNAKLEGILLHIRNSKNPSDPYVTEKDFIPRFNAKGFEDVEFWGARFRVSPISAPLAYSKHFRTLQREITKGDIQEEMIQLGSRIDGLPRSDGSYVAPEAGNRERSGGGAAAKENSVCTIM